MRWRSFFPLRNRHTIRTRLMIWNVGTLALILVLFSLTMQIAAKRYLLASIDRELDLKSMPLANLNRLPPTLEDPSHWQKAGVPLPALEAAGQFRPNAQEADAAAVYLPRVMTVQGVSVFPHPGKGAWDKGAFHISLQGKELRSTVRINGEAMRILSKPLRDEHGIIGVLQVPYPLTETNRALGSVNRTLLALIPVALLLSAAGGTIVTKRMLQPVRQIARTAAEIGTQELSRRLPTQGEDEFSQLAATFNAMLERLEIGFNRQQVLVQELEQMVEQQRRFTADASHELRTPLTIIQASSSLALQSIPNDQRDSTLLYRETLEEIDEAAGMMGRLVQALLFLARADGSQLGRRQQSIDMWEMLATVIKRVQKPQGALIVLESDTDQIGYKGEISADRDEIERLFSNLLENALRYTPNTMGEGRIRVSAESRGAYFAVKVTENGIGIAPEHLPHLGERFYRADLARSRPDGGAGLGLAICKSIVEAHNGVMALESTVGKGTSVTVRLPFRPDERPSATLCEGAGE